MAVIALFTVVIVICSWISIPTTIPFTMQTFGIFLTVGVLGGKKGTMSILIYLLLGIVGIPVFSGFNGGIGRLLTNTGGYILGFQVAVLGMWGLEKVLGRKMWALAIQMISGLLICYTFGTLWFLYLYTKTTGAISVGMVLGWCVIPFVIPDLVKIGFALLWSKKLSTFLRKNSLL